MGLGKRDYGIDFLRILSMVMVVLLHVLGAGGILGGAEKLSLHYEIAWLLETAAYCAVNCYALISGYVGYQSKPKYANLILLWFQVVFCSVGIHLIFAIIEPGSVDGLTILRSFFPVINNYAWYFTCYFALFFIMPLLNHAINTMTEKNLKILCGSILGLSVLTTISLNDIFQVKDGYSVIWLAALYLFGGCLGRFGWFQQTKKWILALIYAGCVATSWGAKFLLETINNPFLNQFTYSDMLIRYKSPTILVAAVCLLLLFAKMEVPKFGQFWIRIFASTAFGVYVIHLHPQIWNRFIVGKFAGFVADSVALMVLKVVGVTLLIFVAVSLTDYLRHLLFQGLKLKEVLKNVELRIKERK
ncbi:MAG: acyltransferase [Clostridia bacterium]|nr:acyltransferase [Clostridia bacterium]